GHRIAALRGHTNFINDIEFSRDSRRLVTASDDKSARVWDARSGLALLTLRGSPSELAHAAFSNDGGSVVTAGADGSARVWDLRAAFPTKVLPGRQGAISPRGSFAVAVAGRAVRVLQVSNGRVVSFERRPGNLERITVDDVGRVVV